MKLQLSTFSEIHKNMLRAQKKKVIDTLDAMAAYLVENGDVEESWRIMLNQEHMINYYDVIPDKGRLRLHEIDLEILVSSEEGTIETKIFKKNVQKANAALINIVSTELANRKARLMEMAKTSLGEELEQINNHIEYTQHLINECAYLRLSSQILVAEIGALHFADEIVNEMDASISYSKDVNYVQFKHQMKELRQHLTLYSSIKKGNEHNTYSEANIIKLRQQFNNIFNTCKSLLQVIVRDGLIGSAQEQKILSHLHQLQHLFYAKCDVSFMTASRRK